MPTKSIYIRRSADQAMPDTVIAWDETALSIIQYMAVPGQGGTVYQPEIIGHGWEDALSMVNWAILDGKHLLATDTGSTRRG